MKTADGESHQASRRDVWPNLPFFQTISGADIDPPRRRDSQTLPFPPDGIAFYSKNSAVSQLPCDSGGIHTDSGPSCTATSIDLSEVQQRSISEMGHLAAPILLACRSTKRSVWIGHGKFTQSPSLINR